MQRPFSIKTKQLRATALAPVSLGILEAGKGPVDGINARRSRGVGKLPTAVVPGIGRIFEHGRGSGWERGGPDVENSVVSGEVNNIEVLSIEISYNEKRT